MKKICTLIICLVFLVNLFSPCSIQAITVNEAQNFFQVFDNAIAEQDTSTINEIFQNYSEEEIIEIFKISGMNYPKTWSYWYIGIGCYYLQEIENAYNYFSKGISIVNRTNCSDTLLKHALFRDRASCFFAMRESDSFDDENVKKAFKDIKRAINIDGNQWSVYYLAGTINAILKDETGTWEKQLNHAKYLCDDYNIKSQIQQEIDAINSGKFWKNVKDFVIGLGIGFIKSYYGL